MPRITVTSSGKAAPATSDNDTRRMQNHLGIGQRIIDGVLTDGTASVMDIDIIHHDGHTIIVKD